MTTVATKVKKEKKVVAVQTEVKAIARYIKMSPLKIRRILNLIRGKNATEARSILSILPHKAARLTEKVLNSAIANASNNNKMNKELLKVSTALADQAFILKRTRAASRGRGVSIHKKLSHVTIGLKELIKESK